MLSIFRRDSSADSVKARNRLISFAEAIRSQIIDANPKSFFDFLIAISELRKITHGKAPFAIWICLPAYFRSDSGSSVNKISRNDYLMCICPRPIAIDSCITYWFPSTTPKRPRTPPPPPFTSPTEGFGLSPCYTWKLSCNWEISVEFFLFSRLGLMCQILRLMLDLP